MTLWLRGCLVLWSSYFIVLLGHTDVKHRLLFFITKERKVELSVIDFHCFPISGRRTYINLISAHRHFNTCITGDNLRNEERCVFAMWM